MIFCPNLSVTATQFSIYMARKESRDTPILFLFHLYIYLLISGEREGVREEPRQGDGERDRSREIDRERGGVMERERAILIDEAE